MAYFSRSFGGANSLVNSLVHPTFCRYPLIQSRAVVMKVIPAQPPIKETNEARNIRLKRPMSPHLLIYKPQLTSMLSITHRATGMALGVYAMAFAVMSVSPGSFPHLVQDIQNLHLSSAIIYPAKLILSLPAAYHFCNGIRHLAWDFGKALTIKDVYMTGYIQLAFTCIMTVYLASL